ncbi:hypothetical protein SO802_030079, partial [Lithocarpus litseifolius]
MDKGKECLSLLQIRLLLQAYSYGESESPCLMPLDGRKGSKAPPLKSTVMEKDVTQLMIRELRRHGNLKRDRIGIIDPDCRLIGLHLYSAGSKGSTTNITLLLTTINLLYQQVIPFDNKGQLKEAFNIRLEELQVLDINLQCNPEIGWEKIVNWAVNNWRGQRLTNLFLSSSPSTHHKHSINTLLLHTDSHLQSTKKPKKKKKKLATYRLEQDQGLRLKQDRHLATPPPPRDGHRPQAQPKMDQTHKILSDRPIEELRSCCRRRTHPTTWLAQPRSHRRRWRSVELERVVLCEMRERRLYTSTEREGGESQVERKCTRIEIHLLTPQGLQPMLDVPIYGRIATLELFRPHGEAQDFLFIATERYKFCVLQWDAETSELITRAMGDVSDRIGRPTDNGQIGIIDPDCRLIGLHLYDGLFKVIPFDNKGQLKEAFNI